MSLNTCKRRKKQRKNFYCGKLIFFYLFASSLAFASHFSMEDARFHQDSTIALCIKFFSSWKGEESRINHVCLLTHSSATFERGKNGRNSVAFFITRAPMSCNKVCRCFKSPSSRSQPQPSSNHHKLTHSQGKAFPPNSESEATKNLEGMIEKKQTKSISWGTRRW